MFFGTSLQAPQEIPVEGGLVSKKEEPQENTTFSGGVKNQFIFLIIYTKFGPLLHLPVSSPKIKKQNYTFGYSDTSFGIRAEAFVLLLK